MAPSSSDPKDLKLILNPARRRALNVLIGSILTHMRSQIQESFETPQSPRNTSPFGDRSRGNGSPSPAVTPEAEERQKRLEARLEKSFSSPQMRGLKKACLGYFADWQDEVISAVGKLINSPDDPRIDQRRKEFLAARNPPPPPYERVGSGSENPRVFVSAEAKEMQDAEDLSRLQHMYHPIPTRLTTISREDRVCVLSCMVLLLLSLGHYSAHSRVLLCYLTSAFELPVSVLSNEETEIAKTLMLASKALSADTEAQKRRDENASSRRWKVGLASVAGAALIGITGGIAAPVVAGAIGGLMGGVGLGGLASFLGIFAMNGALVGTLFGAYGAKMTGEMVDNYAKEVEDFKFLPLNEDHKREEAEIQNRRLRVTVGVNGWLKDEYDVIKPWKVLGSDSEVFALRYEMGALIELGTSLDTMVSSYTWSVVKMEILKRTVLATLFSALWPVYLLSMATSIDNPFSVARNRSEKAGEVLADAIINKAQGERPVTLVGYSLGARVIYYCLKSLAERHAFGLVESVVLIGSPIPSNSENWRVIKSVVSGKVINVYAENDYILGFLYRATSIQLGVAGLQKIEDIEGVENVDLSKEVSGHLRYPELIGKILKRCGFSEIKVEDTTIEKEDTEIQLIDIEEDGYKVYGDMGLLNQTSQTNVPSLMDQEPVEIGYGRTESEPKRSTANISAEAKVDKKLAEDMQAMNTRDDDSDEGGIQMQDNDSDSDRELSEVPAEAMEDDDMYSHDPKGSIKAAFTEQKSLGSFPRARQVRETTGSVPDKGPL